MRISIPVAATTTTSISQTLAERNKPGILRLEAVCFDEPTDQSSAFLHKSPISWPECGPLMAVDVDLSNNLSPNADGNHYLGTRLDRTREISWIGGDVIHNDGLALGYRCTADPLSDWNASVFRGSTMERPKDKNAGIIRVQHIEADPVVRWQPLSNEADAELLQRQKILCRGPEVLDLGDYLLERWTYHP